MENRLSRLSSQLKGELLYDESSRILYSTDASVYKKKPLAVAFPANKDDIKKLIDFAENNSTSLIPRAAGTSLAGQVVGSGIVVDVSTCFNRILSIDPENRRAVVEPGVNLDELNMELKKHGLYFGPETSTSNRCHIGGMVGNNSCGARSLVYGSTRDHVLSVKCILSDGSETEFHELTPEELKTKSEGDKLENRIYRQLIDILSDNENQNLIRDKFPHPEIERRNQGYAIDILLNSSAFSDSPQPFNLASLIAGSEGTLAFMTEICLNLVPLPPSHKALMAVHCETLDDACRANLHILKQGPQAIELMDSVIIKCTEENSEQSKNRFFLKGNPGAILITEFAEETEDLLQSKLEATVSALEESGYAYHFPIVRGEDMKRVWALRKAGLGVLSNLPGDRRSTTVIEDTAVRAEDIPEYTSDIIKLLKKHDVEAVFYAHISTGELHIRPLLNLKDDEDIELFRTIAIEVAELVKKYRGSLSGEHGDGLLRGEFIPLMLGDRIYEIFKDIKKLWDPSGIINPGKITDTPPITENLRYVKETKEISTVFDFSETLGIVRAAEKCSGSGDCRKSSKIGGTMCPSFMATGLESASTRGRANIIREFLTGSDNPFSHREVYEILGLCLSCKACKSECPSNVDMAKLKAEFLQHYYEHHGVPFRSRVVSSVSSMNRMAGLVPEIANLFLSHRFTGRLINRIIGFSPERKLPPFCRETLDKWMAKNSGDINPDGRTVYFFNDEFTKINESSVGIKCVALLQSLGYRVIVPDHKESGRASISKGLLKKAKKLADDNVELLKDLISSDAPLIGVEPSAILTFRDEYPSLVSAELKDEAVKLAEYTMLFDEFIASEYEKGHIDNSHFTEESAKILFHGHCQQKAVASTQSTIKALSIPQNYSVEEIPSGCCGMAGSFGYEKEHYDISMKIGEMVLFPAVRNADEGTVFTATGTSCRHQIKDGTGEKALHPAEILFDALK